MTGKVAAGGARGASTLACPERLPSQAVEGLGTNGVGVWSDPPNIARGEAGLVIGGATLVVRPSFAALVAAEAELGPLFALVERAAAGELALGEMAALFWHCLAARPEGMTRAAFGEALVQGGVAQAMPVLRTVLRQVLEGAG